MELVYIAGNNMKPYEGYTIYGPYKRPDGRYHIIAYISKDNKMTVSYPKYLMEVKLQRYLDKDEEVHHIDGNIDNNSLDNFEILLEGTHKDKHSKYKGDYYTCAHCGDIFYMNAIQERSRAGNVKRGNTKGPYCSRSCNGKANH